MYMPVISAEVVDGYLRVQLTLASTWADYTAQSITGDLHLLRLPYMIAVYLARTIDGEKSWSII